MIFDMEVEFSAEIMKSIEAAADDKDSLDDKERAKEEKRQSIRQSIWVKTIEHFIEPLLTELCGEAIKLEPGQNCQVG